ncbi:hypothetical protein M9H77_03444 [Catharanthus roseus]|uniref:Uncharacterized protein n=1 Tax=Catharanthus roseus TaxID=4058 RepID=A0ACC0CBB8_CATRO|nr:hypothetical protein M9H77_03444 [Catharanthus roseus]
MEASVEEYEAFQERVKRTVYIDNLSPQATEVVLRAAFNQFGNVVKVEFILNYLYPVELARIALVEMSTVDQAKAIIVELFNSPFMISGMPRPVRARAAAATMFDNRPRKPGRNISLRWLQPEDPDVTVAKKIKLMTRKHSAEAQFLLKQQLADEAKLANQQAETLKANYKKYEVADGVLADGTAYRLGRVYNLNISDI